MLRDRARRRPRRPVGDLPIGERQLVEICRVLLSAAAVLILDEPNSALAKRRRSGSSPCSASWRLRHHDVLRLASARGGLRDRRQRSRSCGTAARVDARLRRADDPGSWCERCSAATEERSTRTARRCAGRCGDAALDVSGLAVRRGAQGRLASRRGAGEIWARRARGLGRRRLLGVLFGAATAPAPRITFCRTAGAAGLADGARRGAASASSPADRRRQGLMLERSVARNIAHVRVGTLAIAPAGSAAASWRRGAAPDRGTADQGADRRPRRRQLSGGNQQKVVIGKWLEVAPRVILLDDPTPRRGRRCQAGDLRARSATSPTRAEIVLFRSTELPELVGLADRILGPVSRSRGRRPAPAASSTDHGCCTPSTPGDHPGLPASQAIAEEAPHDPPRVHDAPQAGRARGVPAAPRQDLARARRRDRAAAGSPR